MADVKWISISTDIFNDEKIRLIEKMPEGDVMIIIWLKLLVLAGRCNDSGLVYITRDIPYTSDMLSDIMARDSRLVSLALNTFSSFGMIDVNDNLIQVTNWGKHQNIEGLAKIREQTKMRQRKYRANKQIENSNVTITSRDAIDKNKNRIRIEYKEKIYKKEVVKKVKHGEYNHVLLTDKEHGRLITEWGDEETARMIQQLDEGIELKGYKYKSHNLAIRKWRERDPEHGETREQRIMREIVEAVDG